MITFVKSDGLAGVYKNKNLKSPARKSLLSTMRLTHVISKLMFVRKLISTNLLLINYARKLVGWMDDPYNNLLHSKSI